MAPPVALGIWVAMAGRSMPSSVLRRYRAMAIRAPVLPADTAADAAPSLTCWMATRIEESFFLRKATSTGSSMATTSVAGTMVARSWENDCRLSARPTSSRRASGWWSRNWRHAASVTRGPWSPPMQSTASVIMGDLSGRPEGPRNEYDGQNKGPRYRVCSNGPLDGVKVRLQTCSSAPDGHGRNRWG